jgi:iron complex outermembrane recepter protein
MQSRNYRLSLLATCLTSALVGSGIACAQANSSPATAADTPSDSAPSGANEASPAASQGGLEEIVVTAQKRSERLQDVPIAVTALSGEALTSKGLASTLDIAAAMPGLTYTLVAGSAAPRIRGIGTATALGGNENSVATYVDGVYYASPTSSTLTLNNIEQVAVLKGPQGTLFGRNATGGLIQITTLDPKHDFSGRATASYGTKDTLGASLYVTGGLSDQVAADLAVSFEDQRDGFGKNLFNGKDVNKARNFSLRSKWRFDFGPATTLTISGDYAFLKSAGPARRPASGSIPITGVPFAGGDFDVNSNIQPLYKDKQGGGSVKLIHHFDSFDIVSLTAYRKSSTDLVFDADGLPVAIVGADARLKARQFSQELQAISTGRGPFSWTLGLYYFSAKAGYDPIVISLPPLVQTIHSFQRTRAPAIYGQGTYKFGHGTSLTLGLRYSAEKRYIDANGTIFTRATGITTTPAPLSDKLSAKRLTWRIALDQRLSRDVMVYASYNRGFKSGGFNPTTIFAGAAESFAPEKLDAYELGVKSDLLDRRLRINAAGFYYRYSNIQLATFSNGLQRITNATDARIYGLDADITAKPLDQLTLTAGLSYIHSRFGDFPNAQISTARPGGGNLITSGDATGNKVPFTPNWTLSLGLDYVVPLGQGNLKFSGEFFHSDGWAAEPDNRLKQKPYNLLNASLTWSLDRDKGIAVTAWGKNLTNKVYAVTLQTQNTTDIFVPAAGRTIGATIAYKF